MFENGCFAVVKVNSRNRILDINVYASEDVAQSFAASSANRLREQKAKGHNAFRVFDVKKNPEIIANSKTHLTDSDFGIFGDACVGFYCAW
jgi:hypothetical protein